MKRVLVAGGTSDNAHSRVYHALYSVHERWSIGCVMHGGSSETDSLAQAWADQQGIPTEIYAAEWRRLGFAAGPARHGRIFDEGRPDLLVAFPGGRGTPDLVARARASGVPILDLRAARVG
ncbi:hypothetical protein BJI67_13750 [Acidihalobacter aeolianus]|uniref:YspA cpYpsA-related SLOG domain-containing protein n=1 Tax=Acidihalobacter aeolianus TaxID=2792603 RepID=A0A1D8KAJ1_9GAMM|nr:DUF2493 domain-containing protein [Acidihalobacter aeolianus]AOV17982.1 hypothetical protein BJI67_13750 [Acidihalobacter aeolianus]